MVSFYLLSKIFERIQLCLARTNCLKTSVSRQTISRAGMNKNKHSFASAQVFGLPSSTGPGKVVTVFIFFTMQELL